MKLLLFIFIFVCLHGCASHANYNLNNLDTSSSIMAQKNDVTLLLKPFFDKEELNKYFGDDLVKSGILPIQVRILNQSKSDIGVNIDNFILYEHDGTAHNIINLDDVYNELKNSRANILLGMPFILTSGLLIADINVSGSNIKTNTNLMTNQFKNGVIGRRESMDGIVYMHIAEKTISLKDWTFSSTIFLKDSDKSFTITTHL